jgi:F-type H+-transporting ATPase subunit b
VNPDRPFSHLCAWRGSIGNAWVTRFSRNVANEDSPVLQLVPDLTLLIQIVLFIAFIWAMNTLLFQPALRVLDERDKQIAGGKEKARALETRVEEAMARYATEIREARATGEQERHRLIQEAATEEGRNANAGRASAAEATTRIKESIARESAIAESELERRAREFAALIAERALGRRVE